jgi:transposase
MEYTPRRKLTREFKLEAVRQAALSEKPKAQLARELGVRVGQLRTWRLEFEKEAVTGIAKPDRSAAEGLEQLRRENAKLKMEIEILKNRPRGLPRPICVETSGAYTGGTLGQWPFAFWRRMSPSKNLAQGKLRTQLWWHCA